MLQHEPLDGHAVGIQESVRGLDFEFVDVPRIMLHASRGVDLTAYDEWLVEAGNDLAKQLAGGQDQADAA